MTVHNAVMKNCNDSIDGLDGLPLEALFNPAEIRLIEQLPRSRETIRQRPAFWTPGRPFDYDGMIAVIMKVTRLCNMRCKYCHDWRASPDSTMSLEVQAQLFASLFGPEEHRRIQLIWHGGEPTLIGQRNFLRILRLQRWFLRPGQEVTNRIQTNATRIDSGWLALWRQFGVRVSASIDGDQKTHDRERPMAGGRPSFAAVREGIRQLAQAGLLEHVYWVITPANVAKGADYVWQIIRQLDVPEIGLLPARVEGGGSARPEGAGDSKGFAEFLLDLRAARLAAPEPWVAIREIDSAERAVARSMPAFCELLGNCIGNIFAVDPDGSIQHCDRFVGDPDYVLGHVGHGGFTEARASGKLALLKQREQDRLDRLRDCPQFARCQGWCPHVGYAPQPWIGGSSPDCCGLRPLLDGIAQEADHALRPH